MVQISELMAKERDYMLLPQSMFKLRQHLMQEKQSTIFSFSNARYVRNVIEKAIRYHAVRLLTHYASSVPPKQELMTIRPEDMRWEPKSQ